MSYEKFAAKHAKAVSAFGHSIPAVIAVTFVIFAIFRLNNYPVEAILFLLTNLSVLCILALKLIFKRKRPKKLDVIPVLNADNYSFPSGHAAFYTVFWGFLFYLTLKTALNPILKITLQLLSVYLVLFVGISRIRLKVHWISDVVFGYIAGGVLLCLLVIFAEQFI